MYGVMRGERRQPPNASRTTWANGRLHESLVLGLCIFSRSVWNKFNNRSVPLSVQSGTACAASPISSGAEVLLHIEVSANSWL